MKKTELQDGGTSLMYTYMTGLEIVLNLDMYLILDTEVHKNSRRHQLADGIYIIYAKEESVKHDQ